jgi:hypothetical protein
VQDVEEPEDRLARSLGLSCGIGQPAQEHLVAALQHLLHELLLGGEEAVEPFERHPGVVADLVHADRADAALVEEPVGRFEDLLLRCRVVHPSPPACVENHRSLF